MKRVLRNGKADGVAEPVWERDKSLVPRLYVLDSVDDRFRSQDVSALRSGVYAGCEDSFRRSCNPLENQMPPPGRRRLEPCIRDVVGVPPPIEPVFVGILHVEIDRCLTRSPDRPAPVTAGELRR